jgi:hypothetical protein
VKLFKETLQSLHVYKKAFGLQTYDEVINWLIKSFEEEANKQ